MEVMMDMAAQAAGRGTVGFRKPLLGATMEQKAKPPGLEPPRDKNRAQTRPLRNELFERYCQQKYMIERNLSVTNEFQVASEPLARDALAPFADRRVYSDSESGSTYLIHRHRHQGG